MRNREPSDQELWDLAVRGDSEAFGELFDRHHGAVYNYCFRRTASWSVAEDLVSLVFLEAWRTKKPLKLAETVLPWFLGIATKMTKGYHRKQLRQLKLVERIKSSPDFTQFESDCSEEIADRAEDEQRMSAVLECLRDLPEKDYEIVSTYFFGQLTHAETAQALDIPIGTVKSRLSRAIAKIVRALESTEITK